MNRLFRKAFDGKTSLKFSFGGHSHGEILLKTELIHCNVVGIKLNRIQW